jgi:hypothetical protein
MKKVWTVIFICFLLLTSCVTKNESVVLKTMPSWVTNEIVDENLIYYKIKGNGFSLGSATSNAINNFYTTLNKSVEISDKETFINSLSENYDYEPLTLKIEKTYIKQYEDKSFHIIYLVSANRLKIQASKLKKIAITKKINQDLIELENESDFLYRENKDYQSIKALIQAYILATETGFLEKAKNYLNTAVSRISSINISVYAKNNKNSLEIKLNRIQGFINPSVKNAKLLALYNSKDIDFNNYLAKQTLLPFKNNNFVFYLDNININLKGLVIFKLDFTEEIFKLKKIELTEAAQRIEKVINEKVFSYETVSDFKDKKVLVITIENEINQDKRESVTTDFFTKRLTELGATVIINSDVDIDSLELLKPEADYVFLFRAEIVEKEEGIRAFVLSHGSLQIYDLSNFYLIYDSSLIDSLAINETMKESERDSLINVAKRTYHNFL